MKLALLQHHTEEHAGHILQADLPPPEEEGTWTAMSFGMECQNVSLTDS